MKSLTDRGVKMFDESEFVRDDHKRMVSGNLSYTYFARRMKEPDAGSQVSITIRNRNIWAVLQEHETNDTKEK